MGHSDDAFYVWLFQLGCKSSTTWDYSLFTEEDMEVSWLPKKDGSAKRDRMKKSYSHRVIKLSYLLILNHFIQIAEKIFLSKYDFFNYSGETK